MKRFFFALLVLISTSVMGQTQDVLIDSTKTFCVDNDTIECFLVIREYTINNEYQPITIYVWGWTPYVATWDLQSYDPWPFSFDMKIQYWKHVANTKEPMGPPTDTDWVDINKWFHGLKY